MECLFLANAGFLLRTDRASLAVDTPNGLRTLFDGLSEDMLRKMSSGEAPFEHLRGFLFTHRHSDHYDKKRLNGVLELRSELTVFSASGAAADSGELWIDPFHIRFYTVPHSGAEFADVFHRVFLIEAEGKTVYATGDADWAPEWHAELLREVHPDLAVWNPNVFTHPESRPLLKLAKRSVINHLPLFSEDHLGIGRKCRSVRERIGADWPEVLFADRPDFTVSF
ncbi:MAG: hypothetical protein IKA78_07275 [Oscillospiraceae bacterium]|nr:hypothetical protein [Oscillospiraceae bacterium]